MKYCDLNCIQQLYSIVEEKFLLPGFLNNVFSCFLVPSEITQRDNFMNPGYAFLKFKLSFAGLYEFNRFHWPYKRNLIKQNVQKITISKNPQKHGFDSTSHSGYLEKQQGLFLNPWKRSKVKECWSIAKFLKTFFDDQNSVLWKVFYKVSEDPLLLTYVKRKDSWRVFLLENNSNKNGSRR